MGENQLSEIKNAGDQSFERICVICHSEGVHPRKENFISKILAHITSREAICIYP